MTAGNEAMVGISIQNPADMRQSTIEITQTGNLRVIGMLRHNEEFCFRTVQDARKMIDYLHAWIRSVDLADEIIEELMREEVVRAHAESWDQFQGLVNKLQKR